MPRNSENTETRGLERGLIGQMLSSFYVEKLEHPIGSNELSDLPIRVWVLASKGQDALEISVGSAGCGIRMTFGTPMPVDMGDYGRTLILPQFRDEELRTTSIVDANIEHYGEGERLLLRLSDGSELVFTCLGDDELRPSIDQSRMSL